MCFNPSPERRVPSPNRYMAFARFCFCKNNKRTIDRPSKQPLMVRTFLKVYMELGSYFLFLQEQIKDIIITPTRALDPVACGARTQAQPYICFCHPRLVQAFPSGRTGQGYCVLTAQVITHNPACPSRVPKGRAQESARGLSPRGFARAMRAHVMTGVC